MGDTNKVWIVTPTLDWDAGFAAVTGAASTAGMGCYTHIEWDRVGAGGTRPANLALRHAFDNGADYICYINDDVRIMQENWLKRLIAVLGASPDFGLAAPGGKCRTRPQSEGKPGLPKKFWPTFCLAFFCVVIKRKVFEDIGFLDEIFRHYACDSDFCMRAKKAGWKLIYVQDVYVEHDLSPIRKDWKKESETDFRKRYGWA